MFRDGILKGSDESMSNERVKAAAERIRRDNERQRKLLREEEEGRQKIDAFAPQIWEDIRRVIESFVEGINDELKGESLPYVVKKLSYQRMMVSRQEPPEKKLVLHFKPSQQFNEVSTKTPGKPLPHATEPSSSR
jgi:uncharacterized FlaG/YvyC family protein